MTGHFVLRLRRELRGELEVPRWPLGVGWKTMSMRPDRNEVRAVHSVLEAGFWEGGGGAPRFARWWGALRRDQEFDPGLVFIAFDAEGVVGMAQCWTSAFVKDLAVHPRARRQGIARALLLTAFNAFAHRGAQHVDLKVREENDAARRLYASLGMRLIERVSD